MKGKWKYKGRKVGLALLQATLIVVCVASIIAMDLWDVADDAWQSAATAAFDQQTNEEREDNAETNENTPQISDGRTDSSNAQEGEMQTQTSSLPAQADSAVWRATGGNVQERCEYLLADSSAWRNGAVDYAYLYRNPVTFSHEAVSLRYDELAYLFLQVMLSTTEKAKTCYFSSAALQEYGQDWAKVKVEVDFVLTNKLLALLYGKDKQHLVLTLKIKRTDTRLALQELDVSGDKRLNENLLALGSDVLFGTSDYKAYVNRLLTSTTSHLGRVETFSADCITFQTTKR